MDRWYTIADLPEVAADLLKRFGLQTIYALEGELGSGKTSLVIEMCRQLGVTDKVSSPSYGIVNEYATEKGTAVNHLDCYRLGSIDEAIDAGIEDLLERTTGPVFIEWPGLIQPLLAPGVIFLHLAHDSEGTGRRRLTITTNELSAY